LSEHQGTEIDPMFEKSVQMFCR